jgi:hypothetical protein
MMDSISHPHQNTNRNQIDFSGFHLDAIETIARSKRSARTKEV